MPRKTSDAFSSLLKCRNSWRMTLSDHPSCSRAPQLEAQDEDDPNSFPELQVVRAGIFFRSVDPRERRRRALLLRHARPLCRFSTCRSAVCDRIILDSALQGESGKNRVLVEIALSSIEKATLGVAPLPNRHCGISEVP